MSALAAAVLVAAEGVEPIVHVTTRDRNRIALVYRPRRARRHPRAPGAGGLAAASEANA
jgi:hypothetical protein